MVNAQWLCLNDHCRTAYPKRSFSENSITQDIPISIADSYSASTAIDLMTEDIAREELMRLNAQIKAYDKLYYHDGESVVTDAEYDLLISRAETMTEKFVALRSLIDKFEKVGYEFNSSFKPFVHTTPLLSLKNAFTAGEIEAFVNKCNEKVKSLEINRDSFSNHYIIEPKIDGLSLSLHYRNGTLVGAGTRGDGKIGEDVTPNAFFIHDVPTQVHSDQWSKIGSCSGDFEVRGEVYISKLDFSQLNATRVNADQSKLATARNAAAGSLRQIDPQQTKNRNLRFFAYSLLFTREHKSSGNQLAFSSLDQIETLKMLKQIGFSVAEPTVSVSSAKEVIQACKHLESQRSELPFDSDGAVVKVDSLRQQQVLGSLSRYPNWAIAFKFASEEAKTKLIDITVNVGRTGVLTPVALLEPVSIGGVTITRATLHNEDEITKLQIKPGDIIRIKRSGDVIPKIIGLASQQSNPEGNYKYTLPCQCPVCGSRTEREEDGVLVRCTGSLVCSAQTIEQIRHFCSRDAFDIQGLGLAKIQDLHQAGVLQSISDIFTLHQRLLNVEEKDDLLIKKIEMPVPNETSRDSESFQRRGWGPKSIHNLLQAIDARRSVSFERFLFALGIRHIGRETARLISLKFLQFETFWESLKKADNTEMHDQLASIPGVGSKAISALEQAARNPQILNMIEMLLREVKVEKVQILEEVPLNSFSSNSDARIERIVFSGKLKSMSRSEAEALCRGKKGIEVLPRITNATTIVVYDETLVKPSAKLKKAQNKPTIQLWNEATFLEWIGRAQSRAVDNRRDDVEGNTGLSVSDSFTTEHSPRSTAN